MEQAPFRTRKFVGFVAVVVGSVLVLWQLEVGPFAAMALLHGRGDDPGSGALSPGWRTTPSTSR